MSYRAVYLGKSVKLTIRVGTHVSIPCGHTFCYSCADTYVQSQPRRTAFISELGQIIESANLSCPVCRTAWDNRAFVSGRHIDSIVEVWVAEELRVYGDTGTDLTGWAERNRSVTSHEHDWH